MTAKPRAPVVFCLSGLEPSGRAGLLADVATVKALNGDPVGIATALTAQGRTTFALHRPPTAMLRAQIEAALELSRPDAVKLGMITGPAALDAIVELLSLKRVPLVVDPITGTSRGQLLSRLRPADFLRLAAPHVVLTPNAIECGWLCGEPTAENVTQLAAQGARLLARGFGAVVVKGGHLRGDPIDLVCAKDAVEVIPARRLRRTKLGRRGTGCRFASALATSLARGAGISEGARTAKQFVESYLRGV